MVKKKKTLNQLEYEKALKNLKRRIKAAEKRGFRFDKSEHLLISKILKKAHGLKIITAYMRLSTFIVNINLVSDWQKY